MSREKGLLQAGKLSLKEYTHNCNCTSRLQALNAFLGMFGCQRDKTRTSEYITNARQLYAHYKTGRICQIQSMGSKMLRLTLKSDAPLKTNRRACVMISIFVTSLARIEMMKHLETVEASGGTLFRLSCDSLYFKMKRDIPPPFVLSEAFGHFKKTHEKIQAFVQLGPASSSTIYLENGELTADSRVSGLQLKNILGQELTFAKLSNLLDQTIVEELFNVKGKEIQVEGIRTLHKNLTVTSVRGKRTVSGRKILERRQIDYLSKELCTYPFGYRPAE